MTAPEVRVCAQCRHVRRKAPLDPLKGVRVWTPELIKMRAEWQKEQTQTAQQEEQRQRAGDEFDYEPETLAWCKAWTKRVGAVIDPVTGKQSSIYELCARRNARGDCTLFERA